MEAMHILLADDDEIDRVVFAEALSKVPLPTRLTTLNDGEQLLDFLSANVKQLPHALFLDLNMPKVSGFECLTEIKQNENLKVLPVIIYSTADDDLSIDRTYEGGAHLYLVKPPDFPHFTKAIHQSLILLKEKKLVRPPKEYFVLNNVHTL